MESTPPRDNAHDDVAANGSAAAGLDQTATTAASATPVDDVKPVFRTLGLDDAPDQLQYRSMAKTISAVGPPSLGMMRGGMNHLSGLPGAPMAFAAGKSKPSFSLHKPEASPSTAAPSVGVRTDKTKYVGVAPRALPPAPFRLEMHTHFHVKLDAIQRVCSVVGRKLCELDTDFTFETDKCKWKVEYRRQGGAQRVTLNILLFETASKEYVVEVQRRTGDITALMHLYSELKQFFKRNQLLLDKPSASSGLKRPAPSPKASTAASTLPTALLTSANVRDGVVAVASLLTSKFVDTQLQGVLAAISLSAQPETAGRAELAALIPQLVALGQSPHANVARLVGVALSRLCDDPECRQAFVASPGWQFIVDCAAGGVDGNAVAPEVQRASLHVVESLCPLYHDELARAASASKVLALVQDWQSIEDPRLKQHACNAHRALKDAGVIA